MRQEKSVQAVPRQGTHKGTVAKRRGRGAQPEPARGGSSTPQGRERGEEHLWQLQTRTRSTTHPRDRSRSACVTLATYQVLTYRSAPIYPKHAIAATYPLVGSNGAHCRFDPCFSISRSDHALTSHIFVSAHSPPSSGAASQSTCTSRPPSPTYAKFNLP